MTGRISITSQYSSLRHIAMVIPDTLASLALLTCCVIAGCEAFGLYPYPSLFGFVPPPPRNPIPRSITPTPGVAPNTPNVSTTPNTPITNTPPSTPDFSTPPITPITNTPPNTPDVSTPPNTPDANTPPNTPDANRPTNTPDAKPPTNSPDASSPPNTPDVNTPQSVPSYSPNGRRFNFPFYGRGTQRTFSPFPGLSGWGGFVNSYNPPPLPPETPGFQYTPSVRPDTTHDTQGFVEPHREWEYHYWRTKPQPYPERISISQYEKSTSGNMINNSVKYSETEQEESRRHDTKHYPLTSMINHLTSHTPSDIRPVWDPSTYPGTTAPVEPDQYGLYPEQEVQPGTELITGETNLPARGSKSTAIEEHVFLPSSSEESGRNVLYGEPFLMVGRSASFQLLAPTKVVVAPFVGSNQPFLIDDTLISLFGPRYPEGGVKAMA